jgi:hypothetical protein
MGDQIDLQEARFGLVPLGEGADRDLLLEQRTRFGGRKAVGMGVAMGLQEAICGRCAHREEKATMLGKNGIKRFVQIRLSVFQAAPTPLQPLAHSADVVLSETRRPPRYD